MANQEHLKILRLGADHWNEWRKSNPGVPPKLDDIALEDFDLSDFDLSHAVSVA